MIIRSGSAEAGEAGVEFYKVHRWEKTSDGVKPDYASDAVMMFYVTGAATLVLMCAVSIVCGVTVAAGVATGVIARSSLGLAA